MKNLLLFDQDTQHYRQSIYRFFKKRLTKLGYNLVVFYDKKLNSISSDDKLFIGIDYTYNEFRKQIRLYKAPIIIQFVWLRYKFLLPLMAVNRLYGVKTILWSHGINLQNKKQKIKNIFYYLRQFLANALIIYSKNETQYIKANKKKLFIANNTLNFKEFPKITDNKNKIKSKYNLIGKKIVLCVGRMNSKNRDINQLIDGFKKFPITNTVLVVVGSGFTDNQKNEFKKSKNIIFLGKIIDKVKINEIYKMSDIFCMPGPIGLAINHAFYHCLPVVLADVNHSPEFIYFKDSRNGYIYRNGNIEDLMEKIRKVINNEKILENFSLDAKETIENEATIEKMFEGFENAIRFLNGKK